MEPNVGYLVIRSFAWDEVLEQVDPLFPKILQTDALVIDRRENSGGSGRIGWPVLGFLTDEPFRYFKWKSRQYVPSAPLRVDAEFVGVLWLQGERDVAFPAVGADF